ncbi:bifunctional phosphopantothenoylcysteine decarboxylase/phosphopantothenate--cysteine ligase CoaBC [Streptomyces sp. CB01881]|uniref:bifunctional phosphopantothenoylcysteine decarboxylase/phosphopantothenate--cysteine ligase CoaBC n=1 Tax=Streptomyces sp. CB01881 TaxID=2078691 RepID=UPI0011DF3AFD|nr:bifunctional phosphopantothenoylcysteine decarboxylase/phosphopantothenate--cysteine ligase CoaBC [Streptomyces sp. CB01881]TYC68340.1 bifunctional phosphopantothenoylcysteine decarboxylase/phosphopantothenate--cysteine ligase CoaBC [Streptomyces sp. CB01881]
MSASASTDRTDAPRVVLGVSGGIAAYKACELLRRFTESGHQVTVVPTEAALHFVGEATWAALSGRPAATETWDRVHEVPHVRIGQNADLVVVAPATADLMAKAAHGLADDLLTNTLLTARCPVVLAPAMHTEMWEHPATRENVATLRRRGVIVLEPAVGRLTGKDTGKGRLPEPSAIFDACRAVLRHGGARTDLAGRHVVVSAGGTREPLDPVRFLGNRSSGKQGYALAVTAAARGARVTLLSANAELPDPAGVDVVHVSTALELRDAALAAAGEADAVVMAAAVADFRPAEYASGKIKKVEGKEPAPVALVRNPDILAEISAHRPRSGQLVVGFAAETDDVLANGRAKLARKGCDLLVVNEVGNGKAFGQDVNEAVVLGSDGSETAVPVGPKEALADVVWDLVAKRLEMIAE